MIINKDTKGQSAENLIKSGNEKFNKEEYDGALDDYTKGVKADQNNAEGHLGLAKCYFMFEEYENAIQEANIAIGIKPEMREAYYFTGKAYGKFR